MLSPLLTYPCSGYVVESKTWRWTQWVILFGLAVAIAMTLFMSESYKPVLLKRRAKKSAVSASNEKEQTAFDKIKYFAMKTITRPIYMASRRLDMV